MALAAWAPGMPPDRTENNLTTSYGGYEGMYLDHYRRATDIPHADPWYYHGLLKLAPTKHWDDGTGVDYVFGKVAGNYQAYVAAMRAVLTIRYLLGGMAAGVPPDSLASLAQQAGDAQLAGPVAAYRVAGATRLSAFLRGYNTDFNGQLPVVHLDLQKFDDSTWGGLRGLCKDGVESDNRMGWWGGPGAGSGTLPDNSRDYFITGLATRRNPLGCRPQFTPADFLLNHMPELTPGQRAAQAELRRVTTDAFWDSLLSADLRSDAHILLNVVRKDLDHDYRFARKYGFIMFQGDKFGRGTSIMKGMSDFLAVPLILDRKAPGHVQIVVGDLRCQIDFVGTFKS